MKVVRVCVPLACLSFLSILPLHSEVYTFTTIAGSAAIGSLNGPGAQARFYSPGAVAVDSAGNLFVADTGNHLIRKLTPSGTNWSVSTVAGLAGSAGISDGANSSARFNQPAGITTDSTGNLFVSDTGNHTIRKITPAGADWVVTTIAGFPGTYGTSDGLYTNALFHSPANLVVDTNGNVFVADSGGCTIRKLTRVGAYWQVSTAAGSPGVPGALDETNRAARLNWPAGLAIDSGGQLFVADTYNDTIRKVTPIGTNWVVSTIAGLAGQNGTTNGTNQVARFNHPYGIAVDPAGNLLVADTYNSNIRLVTPVTTNWAVSAIAGLAGHAGSADGTNTDARFYSPLGIAADSLGNFFVVDTANHTVRKLSPAGTNWAVSTIAGSVGYGTADGTNSNARFHDPEGVAVDDFGNVFVTDTANQTIRKIAHYGSDWAVTTLAGRAGNQGYLDATNDQAKFGFPTDVAVDSSGNLLVADLVNQAIRLLSLSGTNCSVTTAAGGTFGSADGTNQQAQFWQPEAVAVDRRGSVFVADQVNCLIRKMTPQGTNWIVTTLAGAAGVTGSADGTNSDANFNWPSGVAVNSAGEIFVADSQNGTIRKVTPSGTNWVVTTIAGQAGQYGGADGTNSDSRFVTPGSVAVDNAGNVLVADFGNSTIRKLTPMGTNWVVSTVGGVSGLAGSADGVGIQARFNVPRGMAVDRDGNIFVADSGNDTIRVGWLMPSLRMAASANLVTVSWPSSPSGFALETSSTPASTATWTAITTGITSFGTNFVFNTAPGAGAAYYRLRKQ